MQNEWNKVEVPADLVNLSNGFGAYIDDIKSKLESESKKVQNLLEILLIELQNQVDKSQ